jgi:hypothetical protein
MLAVPGTFQSMMVLNFSKNRMPIQTHECCYSNESKAGQKRWLTRWAATTAAAQLVPLEAFKKLRPGFKNILAAVAAFELEEN